MAAALGDLARTAEGLGELERARALYDAALDRLEARRARLARGDDRGAFGDAQAEAALYGDAARAALAPGGTGPEAGGRRARDRRARPCARAARAHGGQRCAAPVASAQQRGRCRAGAS